MCRKTLSSLLSGILLCFSVNNLIAQPPQYQAQLNRMFFNQEMSMQRRIELRMLMQTMNLRGVQGTANDYDFVITLLDNTKIKVTSAMYIDSVTKKCFILFVDKKYSKSDSNRYKRIYPTQTLVLSQKNQYNNLSGSYIHGIPADSCWMFKAISGSISAYTSMNEDEDKNFDPGTIVGIQLNDGPIIRFTEENLKQLVGQDTNALESIERKNFWGAIKKYNRDSENGTRK